jgi:hypothetical protein
MALFAAHHYRRAASASLDRGQGQNLDGLIAAFNGICLSPRYQFTINQKAPRNPV